MKTTMETWTIKKLLEADLKPHPFCRKVGQWSDKENILLIDSILRDFYIPPICLVKDKDNYLILDGIQRIHAIKNSNKNLEDKEIFVSILENATDKQLAINFEMLNS